MEIRKVGISPPLEIAGVRLIPVVRTTIVQWRSGSGVSFFASKRPVSILVISPLARVAFAINGEQVPVDRLAEEVPEIRKLIE